MNSEIQGIVTAIKSGQSTARAEVEKAIAAAKEKDNLHALLELFENEETNINDAQLIFTTHNADIMDKLSKYRIILTSKENNESFLYRLDEIPGDILRNDRPISPIYKSGKIGGIPKI